jgi:hypothetical protein
MTSEGFDPQRWDHWLLIASFVTLSSWIIWKVYLNK